MKKPHATGDGVPLDYFRCSTHVLDWLFIASVLPEMGLNFAITLLSGSRLWEL